MTQPLISIGIPTYNRADRFLPLALASALSQDYAHLEIIVSDNQSSDGTQALMEQQTDPRIRYIRQGENLGPEGNFNACLQAAKGEYFLLLHDDDLIDPDMISHCVKAMQAGETYSFIHCGTRVIDDNGQTTVEKENPCQGLSNADMYRAWFQGKTLFYLCSNLYHTEFLKEVGGFTSPYHLLQDNTAIAHLLARAPRLDVPEVKASFRRHAGEITYATARVDDWCKDYAYLHQLIMKACPNDPTLSAEAWRFFAHICINLARHNQKPYKRFKAKVSVVKTFGWNAWKPAA